VPAQFLLEVTGQRPAEPFLVGPDPGAGLDGVAVLAQAVLRGPQAVQRSFSRGGLEARDRFERVAAAL
jgi:hypothetical protein